ncbi:hypothetical protein Ahy_B03g062425 isoform B [Arachis hypogaea]|uniref:Uncharacterized protein n=1 Tax=Arachis hypogaea TaxID=3818 RepID=A0A444ZUK7_ARAHY|nr:hypothetical protein Ahy_B03g062425 isoform B [Arachis hypogaea]
MLRPSSGSTTSRARGRRQFDATGAGAPMQPSAAGSSLTIIGRCIRRSSTGESLERMQRMETRMEVYQAQMCAAGIDFAGGSGPSSGRRTSSLSAAPTQGHGTDDDNYMDL